MNLKSIGANAAWIASSAGGAIAFRRGLERVSEVQRNILLGILRRNAATSFGRQHGFASIRSVSEYQERVAVRSYDDFAPELRRVEAGETNVLTVSPIDHFEPTSGSSGASKLIPYTRELRAEFGRGIEPWICAFAAGNPRAFAGQSYWSLSPVGTRSRQTAGGVRIGFDGDDEYLGRVRGAFVRAVQAVPANVRLIGEVDAFRRTTLFHLLLSRTLSLVSVWHPSFLTLLVAPLREIGESLAAEITRVDRRRGEEIRLALASTHDASEMHATLWPQLRAISCWADAGCASAATELGRLFPQTRIEAKGLLSTEAIVSIPLDGSHALAYRSHFFELRCEKTGRIVQASEAETRGRYGVIVTTSGGLYRYATGDLVDAIGFRNTCPLLRFVGRAGDVSDHFGEKLNEVFVRERLERALRELDVVARFAMLACEPDAPRPRYTLYIESDAPDDAMPAVATRLENLLRDGFHYDYCRRLGQLGPVDTFRIARHGSATQLAAIAGESNRRLGDVKPAALDGRGGWARRFGSPL